MKIEQFFLYCLGNEYYYISNWKPLLLFNPLASFVSNKKRIILIANRLFSFQNLNAEQQRIAEKNKRKKPHSARLP